MVDIMFIQSKNNFNSWSLTLYCGGIDFYSSKYDNFVVLGYLNTEVSNSCMEKFYASYNLKSLIKEPTCFESVCPTSIKLSFTILKTYFQKAKPRIIKYRDYRHFDNNDFGDEVIRELSSRNIQSDSLARFTNTSKMILEKKALSKESMSDITKLSLWTKSCKKQLWIVPGC